MGLNTRILVLAAALPVIAAACGGETVTGDGGDGEAEPTITVGMALDVGGLGDKSFNDAANRGLQQAISEGVVAEADVELLEANQTGSNRDENITTLADQGVDKALVGVAFVATQLMIEMGHDQRPEPAVSLQGNQKPQQGDAVGAAGNGDHTRSAA